MKNRDIDSQLETYRNKRHFDVTPEPQDTRRKKSAAQSHLFVVQKHAARRLHYDFRLEFGGTLKSWAVPKGPSLDPSIKRMAVHVEDHPLSYADFEGTIPAGNYGAGTVIVWDIGTWTTDDDIEAGYKKGHLRFELHGKKLRGHWHLVRTHGRTGDKESWLLIKQHDNEAKPAAQYDIVEAQPDSVLGGASASVWISSKKADRTDTPQSKTSTDNKNKKRVDKKIPGRRAAQPLMLAPQLATLVTAPPHNAGWIYEIKFDGYRLLARINANTGVHLFTRSGNDWTSRLKPLANALAKQNFGDVWLDGEIVVFDANGISNFQKLQNAFEAQQPAAITYMVFDILYCNGHDLREVPLHERRQLLRELLRDNTEPLVKFSEHIEARVDDLIDTACRMHVEGLIGKRADSIYQSNRTRDWIKLKCLQRQEFVIGGYTDASNKNVRAIGALLLGVHDRDGNLRYTGKVGTGFTQQSAMSLFEKLQPLQTDKSPFIDHTKQSQVHWVKPSLLAEIEFSAWTDDGFIRHSSFQGLRSDKPAAAVTREIATSIEKNSDIATLSTSSKRKAAQMKNISENSAKRTTKKSSTAPNVARPTTTKSNRTTTTKRNSAARDSANVVAGVTVSHPERVIDKSSGITKLELVRYYESVGAQLLAHLKDRPVSLVRAPEGVGGEIFFQKHRGSLHIPELTELDPALMPNHPPLIAVDSMTALIHCVQMNVVEFHTWNARLAHSEQPDRMIFDLDPGEGIVWQQIVEAAKLTKAMLDELQLKSFLKTSGGKGLHVVVPLAPRDDWQYVRDFSEMLVRHMAQTLPQLFVATSGPKNRVQRIFIDYLRNNRGSTTAAAFSARLRPGLGVSVPLDWDELDDVGSSDQWHVGNIDAAIAKERAQCWKNYSRVKQTLTRAVKILAKAQK